MIASSVPPNFWADAISTAIYLINIKPFSTVHGGIHLERLCGKMPDYSSLHLFGCVCYMLLVPHECTKLTAQSIECVFLGYSVEHKGYYCWDPVAHRIRTSRDIVFDESCPFYPRPTTDASPTSLVDHLSFILFPDAPPASLPIPRSTLSSFVSSSESPPVVLDYTVKPPATQFYSRRGGRLSDAPASSDELSLVCHLLVSLRMCYLLLPLSLPLCLIPLQRSLLDVVIAFVGHLTVTLLRLS
jgi:hypothetical protein